MCAPARCCSAAPAHAPFARSAWVPSPLTAAVELRPGDVARVDLPQGRMSGLREAQEVLADVSGIKFFYFDQSDVVRHSLVQKIVTAYDRRDRERSEREAAARAAAAAP